MATDSVDTLSGLTGMSRESLLKVWNDVKVNQAQLDACAEHNFGELPRPFSGHFRMTCLRCGGSADASSVHWYQLGLKHGMRND